VGALWVSTGGQNRAHAPVQLLFVAVSALNAYRVATTPLTTPASARMLEPSPGSDWMLAVPASGLPFGSRVYQTPSTGVGSSRCSPFVSPAAAPAARSSAKKYSGWPA
jgi:hypothetical protein